MQTQSVIIRVAKLCFAFGLAFAMDSARAFDRDQFVSDANNNRIARYGSTGQFLSVFASGSGLVYSMGLAFGPDSTGDGYGELYVASSHSNKVMRFNGWSGAYIDDFVTAGSGGLDEAGDIEFRDGKLYVASMHNNKVLRYDAITGAFVDTFASGGGINTPRAMTFGPDGDLFVLNYNAYPNDVVRFNGATGAAEGTFATTVASAWPRDLLFGPDSTSDGIPELYVTLHDKNKVARFNGSTGAYINDFIGDAGGYPHGLTIGPDGNFYVGSETQHSIRRYNGTTGAYMDDFVAPGSGGLFQADFMTFGIPEPSTAALIGLGFCALAGVRCRRRK